MGKFLDLTDQKFGKVLVIRKEGGATKQGSVKWECLCDCGKIFVTNSSSLRGGSTKSCGCNKNVYVKGHTAHNFTDLSGQIFGRWTVIKRAENTLRGVSQWYCRCECGIERVVLGASLLGGVSLSCSCLRIERRSLPLGEASFNKLFKMYKRNADNNYRSFELSKEEFREITQKNCYYCSEEPSAYTSNYYPNGGYVGNGIDRVDNSLGYSIENCVPCCERCNKMKLDMSYEEFISKIRAIYNNLALKTS